MDALFEMIIEHVPAPLADMGAPFLMQVTTLAWNEYSGRIGCGKVLQGRLGQGDEFIRTSSRWLDSRKQEGEWEVTGNSHEKAARMWVTRGLERISVDEVTAGDIVWISGPKEIGIGDVFSSPEIEDPAMKPLSIEEPTVSMFILVNNGPFAGQEGQAITLRQIRSRVERETKTNIALHMEDLGRPDGIKVSGRGELHLAILIEEMRREGSEFCVSRPEVITETIDGRLFEPLKPLTCRRPGRLPGIRVRESARRRGRC